MPSLMDMRTAPEDETLVEAALTRVRGGDIEQFEVIVRRFERPLRAWLAGQLAPGIDVDEIAQQTFIVAFTRLSEYEPGTQFAAWLFSIARYQFRTEMTRMRRLADYRTRFAADLLSRELERQDSLPPEFFTARLDQLQKCVERLGSSMLRFVRWRYYEEIPLEEMAERCGRSVPAVKKQLWILRNQLRECVESQRAAME